MRPRSALQTRGHMEASSGETKFLEASFLVVPQPLEPTASQEVSPKSLPPLSPPHPPAYTQGKGGTSPNLPLRGLPWEGLKA